MAEIKNTKTKKSVTAKKTKTAPKKSNIKKTKTKIKVNQPPVGFIDTKNAAGGNFNTAITKRRKKDKVVKKKKTSVLEKRFWQAVVVIFLIITALFSYYIFKDFFKQPTTPRLEEIKALTETEEDKLAGYFSDGEMIEKVIVNSQGPVIYITYYLNTDVKREEFYKFVESGIGKIEKDNSEFLKTYELELLVDLVGEEVEGYPYIGSKSRGKAVVWSSYGKYTEPSDETEEDEKVDISGED